MADQPDESTRPRVSGDQAIPVIEEELTVGIREVETGRVRIRTVTHETERVIDQALASLDVDVERIPIGREIQVAPEVRDDGETMVIPVVEERLVVEKRLFLREEIHVRRRRTETRFQQTVTLRSQDVVVERDDDAASERSD
ncbi:YsnF/AvaK domain-containing protein [Skermanella stibiiresistens]|uniref:YsnF/AvaK domain-containing protein n=1 Tax=Skermanella stibiiresistens TaxID=913326 RepID=UPI00055B1EC5|nr:YsnF/AvaK domain-containing protein [Skermanella stibiiresistens]